MIAKSVRFFLFSKVTLLLIASLFFVSSFAAGIGSGVQLVTGQYYYSDSQLYFLVMQTDGNLVYYRSNGTARWTSQTSGWPGGFAVMQTDGNFVVYSSSGQAVWNTGTVSAGAYLSLQDDGNIVVRRASDAASLWDIGGDPSGPQFPTLSVDITQYMMSPSPAPFCEANGSLCLQGAWNQHGEFVYSYSNGIVDWIGRSSNTGATPPRPVGVIRNIPGTGGQLRCFATNGTNCTAPPNSAMMPEAVPSAMVVNVVPWATARLAENGPGSLAGDGTPRTQITGATPISGWQTLQIQNMNASCAQSSAGTIDARVSVVYVTGVPFGGDIGTRDALIIDEQERSTGSTTPHHMERYFYVNGWGRVREAAAHYNPTSGVYDLHETGISSRNLLASRFTNPAAIPATTNPCPQGSAPFN